CCFVMPHRLTALALFPYTTLFRSHFSADTDDTIRAEVLQSLVAEVWDVPSDFFRAKLGVASADFEFIDVNRGEDVFFDDFFADKDRKSTRLNSSNGSLSYALFCLN